MAAMDSAPSPLYNPGMMRSFLKMHGLGNDFVVFDARTVPLGLPLAAVCVLLPVLFPGQRLL